MSDRPQRPRAVLLDLLMATMDSMSAWAQAAGDRERGIAWRDAVTESMVAAGRYVPYESLVAQAAAGLGLEAGATARLWRAWGGMHPWPDAAALAVLDVPFGFVTNCSTELSRVAVAQSGLRPDLVLSAEEAGAYKPRSEVYRLACRRLGTEPGDTRFVAGAVYDAIGADAAGLRAVLVRRREAARPLPQGMAVVESLAQALVGLEGV